LKSVADKFKRIGLIANPDKATCGRVVKQAARLITASGRQVYSDPVTAQFAHSKVSVCENEAVLGEQVDLLLVFGGDGTMLRVARQIAGLRTPILGINIGSLGFLAGVPSDQLGSALQQVWEGAFTLESRFLLQATGNANAKRVNLSAFNDIVIGRGQESRLIELDVKVDGDLLTRYRCDGLIISSPTGSTAYSLAAGGAVIFPTAGVLAVTPICPHTLSNRALIVPMTATIEVSVISPKPPTILSADGQTVGEMSTGELVTIRRSRRTIRLMHLVGSSFCETLRKKLHWRGTTLSIV
jgi:NAD+ kinase